MPANLGLGSLRKPFRYAVASRTAIQAIITVFSHRQTRPNDTKPQACGPIVRIVPEVLLALTRCEPEQKNDKALQRSPCVRVRAE